MAQEGLGLPRRTRDSSTRPATRTASFRRVHRAAGTVRRGGDEGRLIPTLRDAADAGTIPNPRPLGFRVFRRGWELGNALATSVTGAACRPPPGTSGPHAPARAPSGGSGEPDRPRPPAVHRVPAREPRSVDCSRLWCPLPLLRRRRGERKSTSPSIARSPRPGHFAAPWPSAPPPAPPSGQSRSRARTTCRTVRPMFRRPLRAVRAPGDRARGGQSQGADVQTRFLDRVAGSSRLSAQPTHAPRAATGSYAPHSRGRQRHPVPARYVSGAEEALTIVPLIHLAGLARGTKFRSSRSTCRTVATRRASTTSRSPFRAPRSGRPDHRQGANPHTRARLNWDSSSRSSKNSAVRIITTRLSGVIGGSLAGTWLAPGAAKPDALVADKAIVSWNAASVLDAIVNDHIKSQAPGKCMNNWQASEFDESRRDYFTRFTTRS